MSTEQDNQGLVEQAPENTVERLREQLDVAVHELNAYRTRVRDRAIKGFQEGHWDLEKLNESLEHLELESFEPTYVHTTRATLDFSLTVAENDHQAARVALHQLDTATVRQAIQDAINRALGETTTTVRAPNGNLTVTVGYLQKVLVN